MAVTRVLFIYCPRTNVNNTTTKNTLKQTRRNSTQLDVELSCVAIDTLTDATQLSPTIGNATDPVEQCTANQALVDMSYKQAYFFHNSINFSSNLHSKIQSPGKLIKTRHI